MTFTGLYEFNAAWCSTWMWHASSLISHSAVIC